MSFLLAFEIFIVLFALILYFYMKLKKYKNVERKFLILFLSVLLFEFITEPLWINSGFLQGTYIWRDITLILTIGWMGIFMLSFVLVDNIFRKESESKRFWSYILFILVVAIPVEALLIIFGVRDYALVLLNSLSGYTIPNTSVPIEAIYGIPLFSSLIICFYKYVNYLIDNKNG